ncbi:succinate dehydrogenase, hydrophobic membrane anchor protein [Rickettsiales bacterium Ac37b]|nr:succinate dehydrogenase, hydrophobic membrane anchor protein [Rickettsiales bacterium Ac37b]
MKYNRFRSLLGQVKGVGSIHSGADHWWGQRLSALALIPLSIWFVITIIKMMLAGNEELLLLIRSPITIVLTMLFIISIFYHGMLGMRVIIEDYCAEPIRTVLIVLVKAISIVTVMTSLAAILAFHFAIFN